jgi:YHS domain-containing protein
MIINTFAIAQDATTRKNLFNLTKEKVALSGYDAVSYFTAKPQEGSASIKSEYQGVTYYFASEENKQKFLNEPAKYEPQYGGWCAYAMGNTGEKVEVDPETFKIIDGKLHLFYNKFFNNTLTSWNKNETALKQQADKNWQSIITKGK